MKTETPSRKDVYQDVTDRVIAAIEKGVAPWRKPWTPAGARFTFMGRTVVYPVNATTGKPYRGINVLLLNCMGFSDPRWLTFKQAQGLGGSVKKGSKGTPIVFWKWVEVNTTEEGDELPTSKRIPMLRTYTVFNVEQCEGLAKLKPLQELPKPTGRDFSPIEAAEEILAGNPGAVNVYHGRDMAAYSPVLDCIYMPAVQDFESMEAYYCTRFHEEVHATGAAKRLNRPGIVDPVQFGTEKYSREELIAEMGSAFLSMIAGIDTNLDQSAAYLKGWLKPLKNDPRMVVIAAGAAQKAVDYILNEDPTKEEDED